MHPCPSRRLSFLAYTYVTTQRHSRFTSEHTPCNTQQHPATHCDTLNTSPHVVMFLMNDCQHLFSQIRGACGVVQCDAAWCSDVEVRAACCMCDAVCCSVLQCVMASHALNRATHSGTQERCGVVECRVVQYDAVRWSVAKCGALWCSVPPPKRIDSSNRQ